MSVLLAPGQNVVAPPPPPIDFQEYPKHMRHPGFSPGTADKEIKLTDQNGNPTGGLAYRGGTSVRFPDVLAMTPTQEAYHASQGYVSLGKSDAAAFARAVASASPVELDYKPIQYPKWCHGKQVLDATEEREWLAQLGIDADGNPVLESTAEDITEQLAIGGAPALSAEANTLEVWPTPGVPSIVAPILDLEKPTPEEEEIAALEAKLAEMKAVQDRLAALKGEKTTDAARLSDWKPFDKEPEIPVATPNEEAIKEPSVVQEPVEIAPTELFATESAADRKKREHAAKIKAGMARAKAAKKAAARQAASKDI